MLESRQTRTKIVVTLGPASASVSKIRDLVRAGADGFRINMSHGDATQHAEMIRIVKKVRRETNRPASILIDLRGPRIRLGRLESPRVLKRGQEIELMPCDRASGDALPVDYDRLLLDVEVGQRILLRDGRARLRVTEHLKDRLVCKVASGTLIASNQGVNLPDTTVRGPTLSSKDRADIAFAASHEVDWIAMSFVRGPQDLQAVRECARSHDYSVPVMAKIERPEALKELDAILEAADAVMVARGDLAVEMGHEGVPLAQKRIISDAIEKAVPVVTATQMLESMITESQPTRAEVSDVANAVYDGTDAVMLSGETAVGADPLRAVRTMHRILQRTEAALFQRGQPVPDAFKRHWRGELSVERATVNAAVTAARQSGARLILAFTETGRSARLVASFRSGRSLIGLTSEKRSFHRMALYWGIQPALMRRARSVADMNRQAAKTLSLVPWLRPNHLLVALTGTFSVSGATNTVRLLPLSDLGEIPVAKNQTTS